MTPDPWFLENLVCPHDGTALTWDESNSSLRSADGRSYPVVDGVPVMLPVETAPTIEAAVASRQATAADAPWYLKSVFLSESEKQGILELAARGSKVDPVAAYLVAATNGIGYAHLVGRLKEYPIPDIRLPEGNGRTLLDVGCSWGRWCVAAARKGWNPVGIDPSLGAVMAARRVAKDLGIAARFIVGDARQLPLRANSFDAVFSYSVIQHFSEADAEKAFREMSRVLKSGGSCLVQMPTRWGMRCLYNQLRRGFRETHGFEVRYWTLKNLRRAFEHAVGKTKFSVDCFFGIGWQPSDAHLMPPLYRLVIATSEKLRALSRALPPIIQVADSVYVTATKP